MSVSTVALVILVLIGFGALGQCISIYNSLVSLKNQIERALSNIDILFKQRMEEISQLVEVAQQCAEFEAGLIQKLVEARSRYGAARTEGERFAASHQISSAVQGLFAIAEGYPTLKSNESFVHLQQRVSQLESSIADRREVYNDAVATFNTRLEQIPDVILARILGYQARALFRASETDKARPSLKLNLPK